jgi:hypothetical protein
MAEALEKLSVETRENRHTDRVGIFASANGCESAATVHPGVGEKEVQVMRHRSVDRYARKMARNVSRGIVLGIRRDQVVSKISSQMVEGAIAKRRQSKFTPKGFRQNGGHEGIEFDCGFRLDFLQGVQLLKHL